MKKKIAYTELLAPADDIVEERVASAVMLREADILLLPPRFSHHLSSQNNPKIQAFVHQNKQEEDREMRETRKRNRPLGLPEILRTPP